MRNWWKFVLAGCLVALVVSIWAILGLPDGKMHVWYLDVGQGDAILMRLPAGEWVLNDGGPDDSVINWLSLEMPFYERTIDVVILSHPHADHLAGLLEVLKRYQVKNVLMTGVNYDYVGYDVFRQLIAEKNIKTYYVYGYKDYQLGKIGFDIVYPWDDLRGRGMSNVNNSSIAFRLIMGKVVGYFGGDLEQEKEKELVGKADLHLAAPVLKASHHGSKTSSTAEFLRRVGAQYVVISCGAGNKFGHPDAGTLDRVKATGATVFRTDIDGTVTMEVSGDGAIIVGAGGK